MEYRDPFGVLIVALSYNMTIIGKIWLTLTILLRLMVVFVAAYPLYQDEQERFICNTLQPGCSNVCYDIFAPVSHFRFWLIQSVSVLLPYAVFDVCVLHGVVKQIVKATSSSSYSQRKEMKALAGLKVTEKSFKNIARNRIACGANEMEVLDFSRAYIVHLILRILIEAGFGAGHYYLFGFFVPRRFSCDQFPCTSFVDCYVSRPTEKSIVMLFILGFSGFSFLLSLVDLVFAFRTNAVRNHRNKLLLEKFKIKEEHGPDLSQDDHPGKGLLHPGSTAIPYGGKCWLAGEAVEDFPPQAALSLQQIAGSLLNNCHHKLRNASSHQDGKSVFFQGNQEQESLHEQQPCSSSDLLAFQSQVVCHHRSHSSASDHEPSVPYSTLERRASDIQSLCSSARDSRAKKSEWV